MSSFLPNGGDVFFRRRSDRYIGVNENREIRYSNADFSL